eukprot:s2848_g1.t1
MPAGSRLPLPRVLAAGMAMKLIASGNRLMGLKLMADHDTYVRPGESIGLKGRDVVRPVPGGGPQYQWYAIVIRDQEDLRPDKTGVYDNSIPFNSPRREYLGELLWRQSLALKSTRENLYPFTADQYRKAFVEAGSALGVQGLHPYQTRHGGASEDLNRKERDALTVKSRGRWVTDQSLRRYGKIGKIQQLLNKLSPSNLAFCQWSSENMEAVLRGSLAPRSRTDDAGTFMKLKAQPYPWALAAAVARLVADSHIFQGKVVLEVCSGLGLCSLFAAKAGARKVIAIEAHSELAEVSREIARRNGYDEVIEVVCGRPRSLEKLPGGIEKVDIIVCLFMGYFLMYEARLPELIEARDRWLKPGGLMFPDRAKLFVSMVQDGDHKRKHYDFFDDVWGFDFSSVKEAAKADPVVQECDETALVTSSTCILNLDLLRCSVATCYEMSAKFKLRCRHEAFPGRVG